MKFTKILILVMLTFPLASCRIDPDEIIASDERLIVLVYAPNGPTREELTQGSDKYYAFKNWLGANAKGWKPSPATYVPKLEVRGKKFVINFLSDRAILNFQKPDGRSRQYVKDVSAAEYQYLLK